MAPIFSSQDCDNLDIQSIRILIAQVNEYIQKILEDPEARNTLRHRCTSKLNIPKQEYFEFSEHTILSNLYWGVENIEEAIQVKWPEEKLSLLKNSESMLQVPALVQEHGITGGIQNQYIICCSYFYLSVVRKLQDDDWQVALHFLQAMLVYPRLVRTEFMPELWERVFLPRITKGRQESKLTDLQTEHLVDHFDDALDDATRQLARRYKDWLMYYQVMLYGEIPRKNGADEVPPLAEVSGSKMTSTSSEYLDSVDHGNGWFRRQDGEKIHPLDFEDNMNSQFQDVQNECSSIDQLKTVPLQDAIHQKNLENSGADSKSYSKEAFSLRSLQDMLKESQSDTPISVSSCNDSPEGSPTNKSMKENGSEKNIDKGDHTVIITTTDADNPRLEISHGKLQNISSISNQGCIELISPDSTGYPIQKEDHNVYSSYFSRRFLSCIRVVDQPTMETREIDSDDTCNGHVEGMKQRGNDSGTICIRHPEGENLKAEKRIFRLFDHMSSQSNGNHGVNHKEQNGISTRKKQDLNRRRNTIRSKLQPEKDINTDLVEVFEKAISTLCLSDWIGQSEESFIEVSVMWELLNNKTERKYGLLKDEILDHLLNAISTSKEERVIRASVFILTSIISRNKAVIEDIKRKGLRLCDLASALKRNVHEAVILIYLINPSPTEIKALELLPVLLEVACSSNTRVPISIQLTPLAASLRMIEVLVTAFDYTTNNTHMEIITSPPVLSRLVHDAINRYTEEIISLAAILIKCMRFDGRCKKVLSQFTSMAPFIRLLGSKEKPAKNIALQFFHEILQMPRSSAINLLRQIQRSEGIATTHTLMSCMEHLEPNYQLLASNLLLQLEMLDDSSAISSFQEVAMGVLLKALTREDSSEQLLSASILANLGGTYSWTGEPYTVAWLVKRSGLTSKNHMNLMRNFDWSDDSIQDGFIDAWCNKVVKVFAVTGNPIFHALEKGLQSKTRSVTRNCLIIITWLGCFIGKLSPSDIRFSACEILISGLEQFIHPGVDLDERLLACLSMYNYASGKGMQKLSHLSEGVRESLRRLSSITWIADELLKVTEYLLPANSQRVSCVHTQVLEAGHSCRVAVSALIYYKGQLHSGHSDGSIKVWDIKEQTATLERDVKVHKKEVTCFTLSEPGDNLLSASADRTIRVWQMVRKRLECVKVIETKETIYKMDSYKNFVFAITRSRGVKVFDASRMVKTVCGSKHGKCMAVVDGKLYVGCKDSSVQEVDITYEREREIKAPEKRWWVQNKPVNGIIGYKDWLYIASTLVEGSVLKDWRKHKEAQMSMSIEKGKSVQAMEVVEDFIYLNCSLSPSSIEIWLRGAQRKVGRLSAGSKITSILTGNDIVLCGTETGLIKGWIPL